MKDRSFLNQPEDRIICEEVFSSSLREDAGKTPVNELAVMVGKYFLRAPYEANTIEREGAEALVVNLRQFDCFTLVENVIVLARLIEAGKTTFRDFTEQLTKIRYRQGTLNGYASRLHYFSDWMEDNQKKGIVKDITSEIGGKPCQKEIHFMTKHREKYPPLKDDQTFLHMRALEKNLSEKSPHIIPKADVARIEDKINDGSIIGITTTVEGLDVAHVGLALRKNRCVHLLHASLEEKRVVVSKDTLHEYLRGKESMSGIVVGWIQPM
jgi:hypothetical protein